MKYIYSHELDQDILNLHVEIKYISLHLNKYNILYSHSFQLLPILFYWKQHEMFSVFIVVALLKYRVPKQFYDDLVNLRALVCLLCLC